MSVFLPTRTQDYICVATLHNQHHNGSISEAEETDKETPYCYSCCWVCCWACCL